MLFSVFAVLFVREIWESEVLIIVYVPNKREETDNHYHCCRLLKEAYYLEDKKRCPRALSANSITNAKPGGL